MKNGIIWMRKKYHTVEKFILRSEAHAKLVCLY